MAEPCFKGFFKFGPITSKKTKRKLNLLSSTFLSSFICYSLLRVEEKKRRREDKYTSTEKTSKNTRKKYVQRRQANQ